MGYLDMISSHLLFSYLCGNVITSGSICPVARLFFCFIKIQSYVDTAVLDAAVLRPGLPEGHGNTVTPEKIVGFSIAIIRVRSGSSCDGSYICSTA